MIGGVEAVTNARGAERIIALARSVGLVALLGLAAILWCLGAATTASAQIVNGNFSAGGTGWTSVIAGDGTVNYGGGVVTVTGNNGGGGATVNLTTQTVTTGSTLTFNLVSYSGTDSSAWDSPVFYLNGALFMLNANGTLGAAPSGSTSIPGTIDNAQPANNVTFTVNLTPGTHTIGFAFIPFTSVHRFAMLLVIGRQPHDQADHTAPVLRDVPGR